MASIFDNIGTAQAQQPLDIQQMFKNPAVQSQLQRIPQLKQLFSQAGSQNNGMEEMTKMLEQSNPQMAQTMKMIQGGGNPQEMAMSMFKNMGMSETQITEMISELQKYAG